MLTRKFIRTAFVLAVALSAASSTIACGGGTPSAKTADHVKPGSMPEAGDWEGVYYNQRLGFLHLTVNSGAAQGAWRTTAGDKWGELYGEVDEDVLKFEWTERKIGVVGPAAESTGHGYFRYVIPKEGEAHELKGEWGLGEDATGHPWDCVKQLNQEPDPKSVRPNEMENSVGATGFDGAKGDSDILEKKEEKTQDGKKDAEGGEKEDGEATPENDPL